MKNKTLYYIEILKLFNEKTGVPILMNTSFNLAGDALVETPEDAIDTFENSDIDYLYFADIERLYTE